MRNQNGYGDVLQVWIVEYIYDNDGSVGIKTAKVRAPDYEAARQFAIGDAPARDFVMSLHPESDEQFLGTVFQEGNCLVELLWTKVGDIDDSFRR